MKKNLLFMCLLMRMLSASGQTNTWDGSESNLWTNASNWSLNVVPTSSHDALIPTGSTVVLTGSADVRSLQLQGNANLTINATLKLRSDSNFGPETLVTWNSGNLAGNLDNITPTCEGALRLRSTANRGILDGLTIDNEGTLNVMSSGDLIIFNGILNNNSAGTVELRADGGDFTYSGGGVHL